MNKQNGVPWLTRWSVVHPGWVLAAFGMVTVLFAAQFPKVKVDTDPKNMLPATSDVRVYNDRVDKEFGLYKDTIVVGIVSPAGIFNPATLEKIARLTDSIVALDGVVSDDVKSLTTVDNITVTDDSLTIKPIVTEIPGTPAQVDALQASVFDNPMLVGRLVSADGKMTAIYVPLQPGANGKVVADRLRDITRKEGGAETYYVAGDPVARDTFGAEMFRQMALFSPLAGLMMLVLLWLMFRNFALVFSILGAAFLSIVWSMGLLIGLGFPVHIMSSMIPVFLMAIATDSIHIFNEYYFRFQEAGDRRKAIFETMRAVGAPVTYTAMATAAGFAALALGAIIPVRVFGLFVAFGTLVIRLMSFTLLPAVMSLIPAERLKAASAHEDMAGGTSRALSGGAAWAIRHRGLVLGAAAALLALSLVGISRIRINNNMVAWFKPDSDVRASDRAMNAALGGTSVGYLVVDSGAADGIKEPAVMSFIAGLQNALVPPDSVAPSLVGKTVSIVDVVKRMNQVLNEGRPDQAVVPPSRDIIAQYLFLFAMSAKPRDMRNLLDDDARQANVWVQMKTWDAQAMRKVMDTAAAYAAQNPPPAGVTVRPAGIAYFNLVWNNEVLGDMVKTFLIALALVFLILAFNFRSFKWGLISYIPLLCTITLIYGFLGFAGKDFDMPVSVLSTLSLGMAVDFAIHFLKRFQQKRAEGAPLEDALLWTIARPGKGILRNAILFSGAFSVMLFANLTPYITVGLFIVFLMMVSALLTLFLLPALIVQFRERLLPAEPARREP